MSLSSSVNSPQTDDGIVELNTGLTVDTSSPGGLLAISIYMETLESTRTSMTGLTRLGLNVEKNVWKNI